MECKKKSMTENEKKKDYLKGYERAIRQMERSDERIREIRLNKICPTVIMDGMPHTFGGKDLSDYAALMEEEERKYRKARYLRIKRCQEISDKIEQMKNEDEKDVLMYRYIKRMKWEKISDKMGFDVRQIYNIHGKALTHFEL